jgi:UDP-3-O-[3-hydroxymyristoyl] glucosamine N-acyltransferase
MLFPKSNTMSVAYTLQQLANHIDGTIYGDPSCVINNIASLKKATNGELTFCNDVNYESELQASRASAVLMKSQRQDLAIDNQVIVDDPYQSAIKLAWLFQIDKSAKQGVSHSAVVGDSTEIASTAYIGPNVVIGQNTVIEASVVVDSGVHIGDNCHIGQGAILQANAVIYDNTQVGIESLIKPNAVLGGIGYGLTFTNGGWDFIPHLGRVCIGDYASIGACSTVDRGSFDDTVIGNGAKIDNQVQIAHNVYIGANTVIAGCSAIGGSAVIGSYCMLGGGVTLRDHVRLADQVNIIGRSIISSSINTSGNYASSGYKIYSARSWLKHLNRVDQVDQLFDRIKKLERYSYDDSR